MARPKHDKRRKVNKTRFQKLTDRSTYNNYESSIQTLQNALRMVGRGHSLAAVEKITKISRSTISDQWKNYEAAGCNMENFLNELTGRRLLLSNREEDSVVQYCLWQNEV